ncbi:MAG TPA: MarR family transcriptional regulator [Chitinophagales bacterium]|nr:MarR family transcriptional regulator [Chitinophagales bacterium]
MIHKFLVYLGMEMFEEVAQHILIYHLKTNWLSISKLFNELAKDYDSTMAMAFVILAIDNNTGTPVTKIAPRIGMEPNSLSRLLNSLEKKGAILRKNDSKDQRKVLVYLTELGVEYKNVAIQTVIEVEKSITKDLSKEEKKLILKIMNNISSAVKDIRSNPDQFIEARNQIDPEFPKVISQIL